MKNDIITDSNGNIDWKANGWPEPNPEAQTMIDGLSTHGMPNDVFNQWLDECDALVDWGD